MARPYRDLVWLAYLALPVGGGGQGERRLVFAHRLVARVVGRRPWAGADVYPRLRREVLRRALSRRVLPTPAWSTSVDVVPAVTRGTDVAFTEALDRLPASARAAYGLLRLEGLSPSAVRGVLASAGVGDPGAALAAVAALETDFGPDCAVAHRPSTDPTIARVYGRVSSCRAPRLLIAGVVLASLAAAATVPLWWGLSGERGAAHGDGGGGPAVSGPVIARAPSGAWRTTTDLDLTAWEPRGGLTDDNALIGRALAAWLAPERVPARVFHRVSARPPAADPQLLYAGLLHGVRVVLLRDPGRVARYAEEASGPTLQVFPEPRGEGDGATPLKLLTSRSGAHYLLPPWVAEVSAAPLDTAPARWRPVAVRAGVTAPIPAERRRRCWRGPVLRLRAPEVGAGLPYTVMDMGRLTLARLAYAQAVSAGGDGVARDVGEIPAGTAAWTHLGCAFTRPGGEVRSATAWEFWAGRLPEGAHGRWLCARFAGVNGHSITRAVLLVTSQGHTSPLPTGRRRDTWDCSHLRRDIAAGTWWKGPSGRWHYLAAAAGSVTRLRLSPPGAPERTAPGGFAAIQGPVGGDTPVRDVPVGAETESGDAVPVYQR
ncbi:hypothetical protein Ssi02_14460 [Sinosporangium siamense]|uniref:DNA-directed RNA polymerase specialized sigma24 family protein n=1 Tax=Sinosporangium siamense TaxID=1367973 RepID=A0A919V3R7_9ACTN|nr:hypothetical protein Ssi02_14460 [Sinosporangium siamense]